MKKINSVIYKIFEFICIATLAINNLSMLMIMPKNFWELIRGFISLISVIWFIFEITSIEEQKDSEINYLKHKIYELEEENKKLKNK